METFSIKIYSEEDVRFFQKKDYACWLNFVERFFTMHVNPSKLLEKSKSLEHLMLHLLKSQENLVLILSDEKM
jgi:hypothetical protein